MHRLRPGDRRGGGADVADPKEIVRAGYDAIADRYADRPASFKSPAARFEVGDATHLELEPATFDGVVSLFMLGHVPRAEQGPLLERIAGWLRPGGWLPATLGTAEAEDEVDDDRLGAPMFFASVDEEANRRMLEGAGLELVDARVVPFEEPGHGLVRFMWVLAQKSHSRHEPVTGT